MKKTRKVLAAFLVLGLVLLLSPARVYAVSPTIDMNGIELFRFPDSETEAAVSIPLGDDVQKLYWLLLESADTPPATATDLKGNADTNEEIRDESGVYLEWPSLELNTEYILYLVAENADGLSNISAYSFTHLSPPPGLQINTITSVSETTAEVSYIIDGVAQTVYWMLIPVAEAFNPTEEQMQQNANSIVGGSGARTLELTGLIPGETYILKMMAKGSNGLCSEIGFFNDFQMTLPVPSIKNMTVFGASATSASVEMAVDFGGLSDGKVYLSVLEDDVSEPYDEDIISEAEAADRVFDMGELEGRLPLIGLMPGTDYIVYCLVISGGGAVYYGGVPFSTLEGGEVNPPVITMSPAHMEVDSGEEASFTVQAFGDGLHYQWQSNHPEYGERNWKGGFSWINLTDNGDISGTNTPTLTIAESVAENYYNTAFRCVVTNGAGSAFSEYAVLTINGKSPVLRSVCDVSVAVHHPVGLGMNVGNWFETEVTLPYGTETIESSDIVVEANDSHIIVLYSTADYTEPIQLAPLAVGDNDVYFAIYEEESLVYYHIAVTRESNNSDGSDPGDGSSSAPTKTDNANSNPSTGTEDYPGVLPQTGDTGDTGLWVVMLIMSILGITGIVAWRKKQAGKGAW